MRNRTAILTFFAIVAIFCLTTKAGADSAAPDPNAPAKTTDDPVVVTVNGVEITESQVLAEIKPKLDRMLKQAQERNVPPNFVENYKKRFMQQALDGMVTRTLLDAEIKKDKITVPTADVAQELENMASKQNLSLKDFKELVKSFGQNFDKLEKQTRKLLLYDKLVESKFGDKTKVSEEEIRDFYKNNSARFSSRERVQASHILIKPDTSDANTTADEAKTKARVKAEALLRQIKAGADFAELAKANSSCPSAKKGGDLGFFNHGQMVPAFEKAAFRLKEGEVSDIVETEFGYHIIKTTAHSPAKTISLEEAKDDITKQLKQRKQSDVVKEYVASLKKTANIVYPTAKEAENKNAKPSAPVK